MSPNQTDPYLNAGKKQRRIKKNKELSEIKRNIYTHDSICIYTRLLCVYMNACVYIITTITGEEERGNLKMEKGDR